MTSYAYGPNAKAQRDREMKNRVDSVTARELLDDDEFGQLEGSQNSLMSERLNALHKSIAVLDDLVDHMHDGLRSVLKPEYEIRNEAMEDQATMPEHSPLFMQLLDLQQRMERTIYRLRQLPDRLEI